MDQAAVREMLAQARLTAAKLNAGDTGPIREWDPDGIVGVEVTRHGTVTDVRLSNRWKAQLGSGDFAAAVMRAVAAAQHSASMTWMNPQDDIDPADVPAVPSAVEPLPVRQSPADTMDFARGLMSLLDEVEAVLPRLQQLATETAGAEIEVRGTSGAVTAISRHGALVRLDCDARWLAVQEKPRIEAELTQVLSRAVIDVQQRVGSTIRDVRPAAEVLDLLADPQQLLRRLGLGPATTTRQRGESDGDA